MIKFNRQTETPSVTESSSLLSSQTDGVFVFGMGDRLVTESREGEKTASRFNSGRI